MRSIRIVTGMVVVVVLLVAAQSDRRKAPSKDVQPPTAVPRTVDDAVLTLKTKWLSQKDRAWILHNPQKDVVWTMYRPFGTGVRNQFGLWGGNQELRDSCGDPNPEGCSVVILNRLWESIRSDADPALLRQLDCQFKLWETIRINYKGFHKLTTGELLKAIQSQIDKQMTKFAATGASVCQSSLTLEVVGKPDMHCYVDAPFAEDRKGQGKETTLATVMPWLSVRNLFMTSHVPPRITLDFARKCQFPTPPYLYGSPNKY